MVENNSLEKEKYKISINIDSKKLIVIIENKENSNEKYENNFSFEQLIEKQIKLVSCNTLEIILELINASIKDNKYLISKDEKKDLLNVLFQLKNAFDNSDISLNLSLNKITNEIELIKKNMKDLINEVKILKKENEELKSKLNNNVVLLIPLEHNKWDKSCPYCGSKDLEKKFAFTYENFHYGLSGRYNKFYLHHLCKTCKKRFFAPDNGDWKD